MIQLQDVSRLFEGKIAAVSNLRLHVKGGETLALLGTSGSGKSTTLKMMNGLLRPTSGRVLFEGKPLDYDAIFAIRLKMGYVIQGAALFPHKTVFENIAIMARMLGWERTKMEKRVARLLQLVGLEETLFKNKYPHALSGGEAQRVGVARALMLDPPCLLMDEPFGALDPMTRKQLQGDFLNLEKRIQKTVVLVTHDLEEAYKLADRIAILHEGCLMQCGTREEIEKSGSAFVQSFTQ